MTQPQHWIAVFVAVGVVLLSYIIFESSALPRLAILKEQTLLLQKQVADLKTNISQQKEEVNLLSFSTDFSLSFLEKIGREEFALVYPTETVISIATPTKKLRKQ